MKLDNKTMKIWEKAPYCYCGADDCTINNHRLCGICGDPVLKGSHESVVAQNNSYYAWNIDHIIPLSRGGKNCIDNLQVVHIRCNRKKANMKK